ncbi:leucyl/phenylalanyl-tRNA--protein transferase [Enterobacteriaceae bacterium BIT-l23]|uniref:Leucyl/phenylalanyl-tRNA--protein transferase n=1 Tax=Jejubacter calystegiae TaxID=2579935 RepID=A0A4V1G7T1_9ENTR|nr:leucyl/phenylalanyl-tRNA--protein transferase [Jejubacter calystegiae]NUU65239.1 leucyl/phenylalanyl-tRNA--protein transferase [Enterobacteriaceae bacterium BIT-l23]QCT20727.1 leucyl/phenylalanyl-tRNA--protein transferase [Jejubacter calystegiae]
MRLVQLSRHILDFPSPEAALREPNGLLALGGDLSPARLMLAYRRGIFPWYSPGDPILWWSPDPRAVLDPREFHVSRSFRRFLNHTNFRVTLNHDFAGVIDGCASQREEGTWITPEVSVAWQQLHQLGHAHSVEVWQDDRLVGGLYGVALGALFCGESMFSRRENASKTALFHFCRYFLARGGCLIDCQVLNAHTASLGAKEIPRSLYLRLLENLYPQQPDLRCWLPQTLLPCRI